jgi:two-component system cell cycle response regulator DivK
MARILVVDDNETNRELVVHFLKMKGHQSIIALNGAQAISLAQQEQPDLILMDMDMPVLNGWDASLQLKQDPLTTTIPILALTAHAMLEDQRRALSAGCDDFMAKPMDLLKLADKIDELIARRGEG